MMFIDVGPYLGHNKTIVATTPSPSVMTEPRYEQEFLTVCKRNFPMFQKLKVLLLTH